MYLAETKIRIKFVLLCLNLLFASKCLTHVRDIVVDLTSAALAEAKLCLKSRTLIRSPEVFPKCEEP